jgi:nicotinamidase-related amidase
MTTALLLVDIQNDYFPGGAMALTGMEKAGQQAGRLLAEFRSRQMPVFHVRHLSVRPGATFFVPETNGAEIHKTVLPLPEEVLTEKIFPNSFRETALLDRLRNAGVEHLVICGAMSHMCIDATTRAAFDLGFQCTVVEDACAARDLRHGDEVIEAAKVHGAFMAALAGTYARVTTAEDIINEP